MNRFSYRVVGGTLVIDLGRRMKVLSSAPCDGGFRSTRYIVNHQVEATTVSVQPGAGHGSGSSVGHDDPAMTLRQVAARFGINECCVGLMTAVPMKQLVTNREESSGLWVECLATVGVTNAVRAGASAGAVSSAVENVGTINTIVVTNAALTQSAMVGAVQVATESKTGTLRDHDVRSWTGQPGATGTGTDAVVIACAQRGKGPVLAYSGTHTEIGSMIGRVVAACIARGLTLTRQ